MTSPQRTSQSVKKKIQLFSAARAVVSSTPQTNWTFDWKKLLCSLLTAVRWLSRNTDFYHFEWCQISWTMKWDVGRDLRRFTVSDHNPLGVFFWTYNVLRMWFACRCMCEYILQWWHKAEVFEPFRFFWGRAHQRVWRYSHDFFFNQTATILHYVRR